MTTPKDTWISVNPNIIGCVDVQVNNMLCVSKEMVQYRFPKSKKKRIRNKWKKQTQNYRLGEVHKCYKIDNILFVSSKILEKMNKYFDKKELSKPKTTN